MARTKPEDGLPDGQREQGVQVAEPPNQAARDVIEISHLLLPRLSQRLGQEEVLQLHSVVYANCMHCLLKK